MGADGTAPRYDFFAGPDPAEGFHVVVHAAVATPVGGPDSGVPFGTVFSGILLLHMFYWTTNQQIIQRTFGAKNLAEGQKGVILAGGLKVLAPMILVLPGIMAFYLFGRTEFDGAQIPIEDTKNIVELHLK